MRQENCKLWILIVLCIDEVFLQEYGKCNSGDKLPSVILDYTEESKTNARISEKKCDEYQANILSSIDDETGECEYVSDSPYPGPAVIGGIDVTLGEFAHSAAIGWEQDGHYIFLCGGSLISSRFVLTAAHCAKNHDNQDPIIVRLGGLVVNSSNLTEDFHFDVRIKIMHKTPSYTSKRQYNDIALIELVKDIEFSSAIRPACLWSSNNLGKISEAVAIGWGVTDSSTMKKAEVLQKVTLNILDNKYCNLTLSHRFSRKWEGFSDSQICAGDLRGNRDTCEGDSGSPLQVVSETNPCIYYILAVTATGNSYCGSAPAVYTRVSSFLDWIERIVWKEEF